MTLEARDLRFAWPGGRELLAGASLVVPDGACAVLLGPSGSGKSTLLRCIAGLESAYAGSVLLDGLRVDGLPPHRRGVGMLFQESALFPHLDVEGNVRFGMRYAGVPRSDERAEARRLLEEVGLADRASARVDELSGGERQRVALVRTLAAKPRAVLLDEPMSALDRELRDDLGPRVRKLLAARNVPALWVTHDRDEARRVGDEVLVLRRGRVEPGKGPD